MTVNLQNDERESWWVTNNTNSTIIIGDLPSTPSIKSGKRLDLLVCCTKEEISKSKIICELVRGGRITLNKQKYSISTATPHVVPSAHADCCTLAAEEDEVLGGSICVCTHHVLVRTDLTNNLLEETSVTLDNERTIGNVGAIQFDLTIDNGEEEGKLRWNAEDGTLEYGLPGGNVNLQVGQETLIRGKNDTSETILNGSIVRISGASGARPKIELGDASDNIRANSTIGWATEDIPAGQTGYICTFGLVRGIKTDVCDHGYPLFAGLPVFLSAETPGAMCRNPATAPNNAVFCGVVMRAHQDEGVIFAYVHAIPRLCDLSNVYIEGGCPNEHETLTWGTIDPSAGTGRWESTDSPIHANLTLTDLPTSDPTEAGRLWNDGGTVKVSAG